MPATTTHVRSTAPRAAVAARASVRAAGAMGSARSSMISVKVAATSTIAQGTATRAQRGAAVITAVTNQPTGPALAEYEMSSDENLPLNAQVAQYFKARTDTILKHYPDALGQDDFLSRVEVALGLYGFNGDNSIGMANLCRDEITSTLRMKIEDVFPICFSTNGLGGVLTCGATGMAAGISHAPIPSSGKEKYVFFAFPHIAINSAGELGAINRPGRAGPSSACGALLSAPPAHLSPFYACTCIGGTPQSEPPSPGPPGRPLPATESLGDIKGADAAKVGATAGKHATNDPEMSILYQRLAKRLVDKKVDIANLDLVGITKAAEALITEDLELLISKVVDTDKADYAVVTGTQIHNWSVDYYDEDPNLEYIHPLEMYTVVDGIKTDIDLASVPGPTARQIRLIAAPVNKRAEIDAQFRPHGSHRKPTSDESMMGQKGTAGSEGIDGARITEFSARPEQFVKWKKSVFGTAGGLIVSDISTNFPTPVPTRRVEPGFTVPAKPMSNGKPIAAEYRYVEPGESPYGGEWDKALWPNWAKGKDKDEIEWIAESEVMHGRWAMMGCAGAWAGEVGTGTPWFKAGSLCTPADCSAVNSIFPGQVWALGPEGYPTFYNVLAVEVTAMVLAEGYRAGFFYDQAFPQYKVGDVHPGGPNFDPLGLASSNFGRGFENMRLAEIKHGRLAMFSFLGYIVQAFATSPNGFTTDVSKFPSFTDGAPGPYANWLAHVADPFNDFAPKYVHFY